MQYSSSTNQYYPLFPFYSFFWAHSTQGNSQLALQFSEEDRHEYESMYLISYALGTILCYLNPQNNT